MNNTLEHRGYDTEGKPVISGLWKHHTQNGFPLELSVIECKTRGLTVCWHEEIKYAEKTNTFAALFQYLESFMKPEDLEQIKIRFLACNETKL